MPIDPETLEAAWQKVQDDWNDDAAHRRFLELSRLCGQLPAAGKRYRQVKDSEPARRESAQRHIDRLLSLAMQDMQGLRTPARPPRRPLLWLATLVTSLLLWYLVTALLPTR